MKTKNIIGVIGAMKVEVDAICASLENPTEETVGGIRFVKGKLCGERIRFTFLY